MSLNARSASGWILAAAIAGLVLRAAFGLIYWVGKPLTHDEREYLALARSLASGRGMGYDAPAEGGSGQQFSRAPGYPMFLAAIGAGGREYDHAPARVKVAQSIVGAGTVWLIGMMALGAAGPRAGVMASAMAAAYPPLVWIPAYVFSETLYSAAALLSAFVLQRAMTDGRLADLGRASPGSRSAALASPSASSAETGSIEGTNNAARRDAPPWPHEASRWNPTLAALAAGAGTGAAILVRPTMLLFVPMVVIWLTGRRRLGLAAAFLAGTAVLVAPWTARNVRVHDRFVLVSAGGGVNFWIGNHPDAVGEGDLAANPHLKEAELEFRRAHPGLSPEELEPLYYRDALASIASAPGRWLLLLGRKLFYTAVPIGPSYTLHSTRYQAASVVSYLLVAPLALMGLPRLLRAGRRRPTAVLLLGASAVLTGLVFFPQERYRIPVMDPVLILAAASRAARHASA